MYESKRQYQYGKIVAVVLGRAGLLHHFQGDSRNGYLSVTEILHPGVYHALKLEPRTGHLAE